MSRGIRILGIDPSLSAAGFVVLEGSQQNQCEWRVVKSGQTGIERVAEIAEHGLDLARRAQVNVVAVEGPSFASAFSHQHQLGQLAGVMYYLFHKAGIRVEVWPPTTCRKALTGKGNLAKAELPLAIFKRFGVEFPGAPDALDAWIVACTAWLFRQEPSTWLEFQAAAFKARSAE